MSIFFYKAMLFSARLDFFIHLCYNTKNIKKKAEAIMSKQTLKSKPQGESDVNENISTEATEEAISIEPIKNQKSKPRMYAETFFKKTGAFFWAVLRSIGRFFRSKAGYITVSTLIGILFVVAVTIFPLASWYSTSYNGIAFNDLIMILAGPTEGTDMTVVKNALSAGLPYAICATAVYVEAVILLANRRRICRYLRSSLCIVVTLTLVSSLSTASKALGLDLTDINAKTTIFEDYYVDPKETAITADGKTKNLIYIYLESMESTHTGKEYGGYGENYIPNLTQLALDNVNFSHLSDGNVGGFYCLSGTSWTIAGLLSSTSGVPFKFAISEKNSMNKRDEFGPGITSLGDILEEKGYKNFFLCGSDATFGGRRNYFTQHGNYEIYDLNTARAEGAISYEHNKFWGYDDRDLYRIAKEQLTELASGGQPFNFTMLTVDTHPTGGYECKDCGTEYDTLTENVVKCADTKVGEFVEWIKAQDFYEDSVIIISGDHTRMELPKNMIPSSGYDRRVYNCFINSAVEPSEELGASNRGMMTADLFPTILASMGFKIDGERLGLGTNMFSSTKSLVEVLGNDYIDKEFQKKSDYYFYNFDHPELAPKAEEE